MATNKSTATPLDEQATSNSAEQAYQPKQGEENFFHVKLYPKGRFDADTGEEVKAPVTQIYSTGEWRIVESRIELLGFTGFDILHQPAV